MSHKRTVETLDRTLHDLKDNTKIMERVTLVLAGEFRQILPVISRGTSADQTDVCLKKSVWKSLGSYLESESYN